MKRELRIVPGTLKRSAGDKPAIEGYAAMFNVPSEPLGGFFGGGFTEIIKPGAFANCLASNPDVRCLWNHDPNFILGRTKSGTLSLNEDDRGLHFRCQMPDTQLGRDLYTSIDRGDVDGCSFGFQVTKQTWTDEEMDDGTTKSTRELLEIDLFDAGPVTFPAYPQTSVAARSQVLWPDGMPAEVRSKLKKRGMEKCACACEQCMDSRCEECSNEHCSDEACMCEASKRSQRDMEKCSCACEQCSAGNCEECSNEHCADENCACENGKRAKAKKKKIIVPPMANSQRTNSNGCSCDCEECVEGNCMDCTDSECDDDNCEDCPNQERSVRGAVVPQPDCMCSCDPCVSGDCVHCSNQACQDLNCNTGHNGQFSKGAFWLTMVMASPAAVRGSARCSCGWVGGSDKSYVASSRKLFEAHAAEKHSGMERRGDAKTWKVDGDELSLDAFAYRDKDKPKLPIKFSTDEKTKSHIRNALSRYNQTDMPDAEEKKKAWSRIVAAAKANDIKVSEENSKTWHLTRAQRSALMEARVAQWGPKHDPDNDGDDDSKQLDAMDVAATTCTEAAAALRMAAEDYDDESLSKARLDCKKAIAVLEKAVAAIDEEMSEGSRAGAPPVETRETLIAQMQMRARAVAATV